MRVVTAGAPGTRGRAELERLRGFLRAVAAPIPPRRGTVTIAAVGERRMARLNRLYRGRRGAVEILTFSHRGIAGPGREATIGEICLCWPRLELGAKRRMVSRKAYAARLLVHGIMHLGGYRHGTPDEERRMERAERRALCRNLAARELDRLFA